MCSDFSLNRTGHAYPLKCRVRSSTVNGMKCTRYMIRLGLRTQKAKDHRPHEEVDLIHECTTFAPPAKSTLG